MTSTKPSFIAIPIFLWFAVAPLYADEASTDKASWLDRFELHGHLSVAYAEASSDGLEGDLVSDAILGLSEDGSADYRNAALMLRFRAADRHTFVAQLSHQNLADSVLGQVTDDVEINWLFWDWQIGTYTRLRLGRLPTPAGIFNEVRDVGTVLPFFRPAFNFYREGSLFSESIDGVSLSHQLFTDTSWQLEATVYFGEFEVFEQGAGIATEIFQVDADNALGTQLWLDTPLDGVRLGVGTLRWDVSEESQFNSTEATWESWYASVDASFQKWELRSEHRVVELPFETRLGILGEAEVTATYFQVGWHATDQLSFYAQSELTDINQRSDVYLGGSFDLDERDDVGIAVNYAFRPSMVAKVEFHWQDFELTETVPIFTDEGLRIRIESFDVDNEYFIAGLAFSF